MAKYYQGKFKPRNPSKYKGDVTKIIHRSSWERKVMVYLDTTPHVVQWGSEEIVIPYVSPVDGDCHRYYMDFNFISKTADGYKTFLIEVKPEKEKHPPKKQGKRKSRYIQEVKTYVVNQAKWKAAEALCEKRGWTFMVWTEKELKMGAFSKK